MDALRRIVQITGYGCFLLLVPMVSSTQESKPACGTSTAESLCGHDETAGDPGCQTTCTTAAQAPVCGVSGASCGTLTAVDFDPARNAATTTNVDLGFQSLDDVLEPIRATYRVPGLVVAVARSSGVFAAGAAGVRVAGAPTRVTATDRFHIGSCTKSVTASIAAALVERGRISWEATVAEIFRDIPDAARSTYANVTLAQLLAHRSGMPTRDAAVMEAVWTFTGDTKAQRDAFVRMALELPPAAAPGTAFVYTDVGYTVAGVMLERAAGKSWEELVGEYVATPLELTSVGFGEPAAPGTMDQPWGHVADGTRTIPFAPGPYAELDNPAVIGPAGLLHLSIVDWGAYASEHLKGARGDAGVMLSPDSYRALHANVENQNYGLGWGVGEGTFGPTLSHTGSCGEWYSIVSIMPDIDLAVVVATNISGGNGVSACSDVLQSVTARYATTQAGAAAAAAGQSR